MNSEGEVGGSPLYGQVPSCSQDIGLCILLYLLTEILYVSWTTCIVSLLKKKKVFIELVTILLLLYAFSFFGCKACGILVP